MGGGREVGREDSKLWFRKHRNVSSRQIIRSIYIHLPSLCGNMRSFVAIILVVKIPQVLIDVETKPSVPPSEYATAIDRERPFS